MEIETRRPEQPAVQSDDDDDECVILETPPDARRRAVVSVSLSRETVQLEDDPDGVGVGASVASLQCAISYLPLEHPVTFSGCLERHPFRVFSAACLREHVEKALRLSKKKTTAGAPVISCPVCDRAIAFRRVGDGAFRPEDGDEVRACLYLDLVRCRVDVLNAARDSNGTALWDDRFATRGKDLWTIAKSASDDGGEGVVQVLTPQELASGLSAVPHEDFLSVVVRETTRKPLDPTLARWLAPAPEAAAILAKAMRPVPVTAAAVPAISLKSDVPFSEWIQRVSLDVERYFQDTLRRAPDADRGEWVGAWKKFWGETHASFATWAVRAENGRVRGRNARTTSKRKVSCPLGLQKTETGFHTRIINDLRREPPFHVSGLSPDLRDALLDFWRGRKEEYLSRVVPLMKKAA